jgi:hypothetical protein
MKLSEQMAAETKRLFEQHKDDNSVQGAAIRLSLFMRVTEVNEWLRDEVRRGTEAEAIAVALVNAMAAILIQCSGIFGRSMAGRRSRFC